MGRPLSQRVRIGLEAPAITHSKPTADWGERAACRDADPKMFDVVDYTFDRNVLAMCGDCPVRLDCLLNSLAFEIVDGTVYAGMTTHKRELFAKAHPELVTWEPQPGHDWVEDLRAAQALVVFALDEDDEVAA